jgi:hypothetical protein
MDSWKEQTGLSEEDIARYWKLANDQRGKPEFAMMDAQKVMGGGVLDPAIEHIGDLTNRMGPKHSPGFSYEETKGKAEKYLRSLRSGYGFRREFEENLVSNAKFFNKPLEQHKADVDAALKAYANAHAELQTYNPIQTAARDAAVALGNKEFENAADLLENMLGMMQDQDQFFLNLRPVTPTAADDLAALTAKAQTDTPEFKNFFGESKVVDAKGKPLVVYRGLNTSSEEALNVGERKSYANFASSSPHVASSYANPDEPFDSGGPVLPLYIKADKLIEFPVKVSTYDGARRFDKFEFDRRAKTLNPGEVLVARQVYDIGPRASVKADPERLYSYPSDIYAWNKGVSVKSAIGNEGTFDPTNPVITKAKGGEVSSAKDMLDRLTSAR